MKKNRDNDIWDYKRKLKRDSILLLMCAVAIYVIYCFNINPIIKQMGFWKTYNSTGMKYIGISLLSTAIVYSIVRGDIKISSVWGQREGRAIRLSAAAIDTILNYHITKLFFLGMALLANLAGLI